MEWFLGIGGVVTLVVVACFLWVGWRIYRNIKALVKFIKTIFAIFGGDAPPATISLVERAFPGDDREVARRVRVFEEQGFQRAGAFDVAEMGGAMMIGLVHETARLIGVVYRHEQAGVWSDVVVNYQPEGSLTVTNAPMGHELDHRPGHEKLYDKTMDEAALLARMASEASRRERRVVRVEEFAAEAERAYAEDMAWRAERGGPTTEEIERVASDMDGKFSPDQIAQAKQILSAQAGPREEAALREAFAASMNGDAWERTRHRALIVRPDADPEALEEPVFDALGHASLAERYGEVVDEAMSTSMESDHDPHALVLAVNQVLPAEHRFRPIASVDEPSEAVLYVLS